jgi:uncharacterized coiled-coil DUF342 family protein
MPLEIDISNLQKRIDDATEGIVEKIEDLETELNDLKEIQFKRDELKARINELADEIDQFLEDANHVI